MRLDRSLGHDKTMSISTQVWRRLLRGAAIGLTLAAVAAPTAHAYDHFYEPFSPTATAFASYAAPMAQARERYYEPFSPTEKAPELWRESPSAAGPAPAQIVAPGGFAWADAGIGAAVGVAAGLVLALGALLAVRRRDRLVPV